MLILHILFWFALMLIAIGNGALREMTYGRIMGELPAHQLSTLSGVIFSGIAVYILSRIHALESAQQAWIVGIAWLLMTVAFEFLFGHFVMGHPWSRLLHDYDLFAGRLWLLFLLWVLAMPYLFYKIV